MTTNTNTDANKAAKAIKAGTLAISAEKLGNAEEAAQAGRTGGELARRAGLDLDTYWRQLGESGIGQAELTWHSMVDGWYDAAV